MKQTIVFFALMALMTTMVFAQVQIEPNVNILNDISQTSYADIGCWTDGTDMFCAGGDEDNLVRMYDVSENTWTETGGDTGMYYPVINNGGGCRYYSGYAYCPDQGGTGTIAMFKVSSYGSGNTHTDFTKGTYIFRPRCDLKPGTDEMWCWSAANAGASPGNLILKYDIGDDTWTEIKNVDFEGGTGGINHHYCIFPNNDELWCFAGAPYVGTEHLNNIMVYDTVTNTSDQTRTFDVMDGDGFQCFTFLDGIVYCFGAYDDWNDPINGITDNIYWYNTLTDTNGILDTGFPYEISVPGMTKIGSKIFTIGGYRDITWDYGQDIIELDFTTCGTSPTGLCHQYGDLTLDPGTHNAAIVIETSDTTLDCNGATLDGQNSFGLGISGGAGADLSNIVIKNCNLMNYLVADIYVSDSGYLVNTMTNWTIQNSTMGYFSTQSGGYVFDTKVLDSTINLGAFFISSGTDNIFYNNYVAGGFAASGDEVGAPAQVYGNTFDGGLMEFTDDANFVYCVDGVGNDFINGAVYSGSDPNEGTCAVASSSRGGAAHQAIINPNSPAYQQSEPQEGEGTAFSIFGEFRYNLLKFLDEIMFRIRSLVGLE